MQHLAFPSRQIGDFEVTALSDGAMAASLDLLSGIDALSAGDIQHAAGITPPGTIHINSYLIRGRGRVILVDAGTGGRNNAGGQLIGALRRLGIAPQAIDTVLLTHGHPDHLGGLLTDQGAAVFPRATLWLHPLEAAFWHDEARFSRANERVQRNITLARRTLECYAPRLRLTEESAILPGIYPVWLPGHTTGHTGFQIESGGERLLIWGDIVHYPHIQTACPDVSVAFDNDPAQAEATRHATLAKAASERLLIAGMHLGCAGFAFLHATDTGYRLAYAEATESVS